MATEGFSGVVRLSSVDDYITPSQNCIIPVGPAGVAVKLDQNTDGESPLVSIAPSARKGHNKSSSTSTKPKPNAPVQITLNDCLACSGCVTTAEAVLIEQQSGERLLADLAAQRAGNMVGDRLAVVTVSPQSIASIAAHRNMSLVDVASKLQSFFKNKGANYVIDSSFGRNFSLMASFDEFVSSEKRPIFASSCPGWVCYAEKTHGALIVPHLSRVRSPQAVTGALVKDYLAKKAGVDPGNVYHAAVMPCFDKKLEASRDDFLVPGTAVKEVDCVASTMEVDRLLDASFSDDALPSTSGGLETSNWLSLLGAEGNIIGHSGGSSGGYAEYVLHRMITEKLPPAHGEINICTQKRNKDLEEMTVTSKATGDVLLRVAKAYGFRNIQNVVQKMKRNLCKYDYVEVMACPGGCTNGGGQISKAKSEERQKNLERVNELYSKIPCVDPVMYTEARNVCREWLGDIQSEVAQNMLYTDFHPVTKNVLQTLSVVRW